MEEFLTAIETHAWTAFWVAFFAVLGLWAVFGGLGRGGHRR